MSKLFVDQVDPKTATTLTLGTSGDTISIPSGVTIANAGTATGFDEIARGTVAVDTARCDIMTGTASALITCSAGDEITCKGFVDNVSGSNTRFAGESGNNRTYFLGFKVAA